MNRWPRRIGILGAGALGSLLAYALTSRTSSEVRLFARSHYPGEVTVEGEGRVAIRVASPATPVDLLIVAVKAYATGEAIRWGRRAIGPETVALTLQNGLGNAEAIADTMGADRVIAGTTAQGALLLGPGRVAHRGGGPTVLAPWQSYGPAADRCEEVAILLNQAGLPAETDLDPLPLLWSKLAVNCGINAVSAILRVPNGALLERPDALAIMEAAVREVGAVAAAAGIRLPQDPVAQTRTVAQATAQNRSSMLQDVERGRRTEIEAINGAVTGWGERIGVPTPVNQTLARLVRALSADR